MPYPYDQIFAADPASPENVASNGVVTIFAPGDPSRAPLTITTLDGLPLSNPVQVNDAGFGPAFMHATLDQVAWGGGGFSGLLVSYKGMKEEAVAARRAAEAAAQDTQKPTDESVDRGIQRADIPARVARAVAESSTVTEAAAAAVNANPKVTQIETAVTAVTTRLDSTAIVVRETRDAADALKTRMQGTEQVANAATARIQLTVDQLRAANERAAELKSRVDITEAQTAVAAQKLPGMLEMLTQLDTSKNGTWRSAWDANAVSLLREWFRANTGPRVPIDYANPLTGLVTIGTQAEADALRGKLLIGGIQLTAPMLELSDFVVRGTSGIPILLNYKNTGTPVNRVKIHHAEFDGQYEPDSFGIDGPSYSSNPGTGIVTEYCHFHRLGEGMRAAGGSITRYNWIHDMFGWDELVRGPYVSSAHPHSDAMQVTGGAHVEISRNFIEHLAVGPNKIACIEINPKSMAITNAMVRENYMAGGAWTMNILDDVHGRPDVTVRDNKIGGGFIHTVFNIDGDFPAGKFTGNVWAETGEPVPLVPRRGIQPRRAPLLDEDPNKLGFAPTYLGPLSGSVSFPAANGARFLRVLSPAVIRSVALEVVVGSGKIAVGVYRPSGVGLSAGPGELVATSGVVDCPGAGFRSIALGQQVAVRTGDYLAIACDNTTASFLGVPGSASRLTGFQFAGAAESMPLVSNPAVAPADKAPVLAGHI